MADEDSTDIHNESTDSLFNEAILMTSTDTISSETTNSILRECLPSIRHNSISHANCVVTSTKKLPANSIKESSPLDTLWERKKQSMAKNNKGQSLKTYKHDVISSNVKKNVRISDKKDKDVCSAEDDFTTNSLEESNIWPALTMLDQSLSEGDGNTSKENDEIIEKLYNIYSHSPRTFTEHLITILEETTDVSEKTNVSVTPGLIKLLNEVEATDKVIDNESVPQNFISSSTESGESTNHISTNVIEFSTTTENGESTNHISTNLMKFSTMTRDSLENESNVFDDNSTGYASLEELNAKRTNKIRNVTFEKSPKKFANDTSTKNDLSAVSPVPTSTLLKNKTYRKTPKIVVQPGTPQNKRISTSNIQSPTKSNDDEEYLTADSEYDNDPYDETLVESSSTSKNETINMSKIVSHHKEWINTYEKVSRYKPVNVVSASEISGRNGKIAAHTNKLEKRWLEELAKKRQSCFDMVDRMLKKNSPKSTITESELSSLSKRKMDFFKLLMTCSEYFTYITTANSFDEPEASKKKNRRSIAKSSLKSKRRSLSHSRVHNATKKTSKKTLEKKVTRRSIGKRPKGATPEIDRSHVRPVSELRTIFSPRPVNASVRRNIPMPPQPMWKSIQTSRVSPATSKASNAINKVDDGGLRTAKKFKNVKSPVREYIRKEYKKPMLFNDEQRAKLYTFH